MIFYSLFTAINIAGVTIFTLGVLAVLVILFMYIDTMKHIMKYAPALVKTHSAFVLSVYPVNIHEILTHLGTVGLYPLTNHSFDEFRHNFYANSDFTVAK